MSKRLERVVVRGLVSPIRESISHDCDVDLCAGRSGSQDLGHAVRHSHLLDRGWPIVAAIATDATSVAAGASATS